MKGNGFRMNIQYPCQIPECVMALVKDSVASASDIQRPNSPPRIERYVTSLLRLQTFPGTAVPSFVCGPAPGLGMLFSASLSPASFAVQKRLMYQSGPLFCSCASSLVQLTDRIRWDMPSNSTQAPGIQFSFSGVSAVHKRTACLPVHCTKP